MTKRAQAKQTQSFVCVFPSWTVTLYSVCSGIVSLKKCTQGLTQKWFLCLGSLHKLSTGCKRKALLWKELPCHLLTYCRQYIFFTFIMWPGLFWLCIHPRWEPIVLNYMAILLGKKKSKGDIATSEWGGGE